MSNRHPLVVKLKSGEYDGKDIMEAWCLIESQRAEIERLRGRINYIGQLACQGASQEFIRHKAAEALQTKDKCQTLDGRGAIPVTPESRWCETCKARSIEECDCTEFGA